MDLKVPFSFTLEREMIKKFQGRGIKTFVDMEFETLEQGNNVMR
jgi:hypothetical protein